MSNNEDLERIADLCLNYKPNELFNQLADRIKVLELEVKLLNERISRQSQEHTGLHGIHKIMKDQFNCQ